MAPPQTFKPKLKKIQTPKKPRLGSFAKVSNPKLEPLKTRVYTKDILNKAKDPSEFGVFGFGNTGLRETPSIQGMGASGPRLGRR